MALDGGIALWHIKSREEGTIGSNSREKGDLHPPPGRSSPF